MQQYTKTFIYHLTLHSLFSNRNLPHSLPDAEVARKLLKIISNLYVQIAKSSFQFAQFGKILSSSIVVRIAIILFIKPFSMQLSSSSNTQSLNLTYFCLVNCLLKVWCFGARFVDMVDTIRRWKNGSEHTISVLVAANINALT